MGPVGLHGLPLFHDTGVQDEDTGTHPGHTRIVPSTSTPRLPPSGK